jgi:argininosuccinate lyase
MRAAAGVGYTNATDLADWLVRAGNVPFRDAHGIAARCVKVAEERGCALEDLPLDVLQAVDPRIDERIFAVLGVENSVASRTSEGGTAPVRVQEAIAAARVRFL